MQALLVTGGAAPPRARLASRFASFALVCAADSGLDTLASWGLEPDLIVGDMDSVSSPSLVGRYPRAGLILAPRDKDLSDTELGLEALSSKGAENIVLAGGGGGRLDHLLAIRALFERRGTRRPMEWHTPGQVVFLLEEGQSLAMEARPGSTVSVFPLAGGADGMESEGLKWPLAGLEWGPGDCGLSNVATVGPFTVRAGRGDLLVLLLVDDALTPGEGIG